MNPKGIVSPPTPREVPGSDLDPFPFSEPTGTDAEPSGFQWFPDGIQRPYTGETVFRCVQLRPKASIRKRGWMRKQP